MKQNVLIAWLVLLVVTLACSFSTRATPTATANPTNVSPELINPTPQNAGENGNSTVLLQDDFSDPNSGWITTDQDGLALDYADGSYRVVVKTPLVASFSAFPDLQLEDVSIEADAHFIKGPKTSLFGLLCRATANPDLASGYEMIITADGRFSIVKITGVEQGQEELLTSGSSITIKPGPAINHLRMDCVGSQITIFVNGLQMAQVTDPDYSRGRVGFDFGSNYDPGFEVRFDNFIVRQAGN